MNHAADCKRCAIVCTLKNGRELRHTQWVHEAHKVINVDGSDACLSEVEWQEYCDAMKALVKAL